MTKKITQKFPIGVSTVSRRPSAKQTIAATVATHQTDPIHKFHSPAQQKDGRVPVATGERLQRVRARAHVN